MRFDGNTQARFVSERLSDLRRRERRARLLAGDARVEHEEVVDDLELFPAFLVFRRERPFVLDLRFVEIVVLFE